MGIDLYDQPYQPPTEPKKGEGKKAQYLSVYWKCCKKFSRIYKNREKTAYEGCCIGCGSSLRVPVGEGGTSQRTFIAE